MFFVDGDNISLIAGSAITAGQCVKIGSSDETVIPTAAATDVAIGFAVADAASGARVTVKTGGVVKAIASAAISRGAVVGPSATAGRVVTGVSTARVLGVAISAAAANGDYLPVVMVSPTIVA